MTDHDSVTCLILGLAGRLARAEQDSPVRGEKTRAKLAEQLADAMVIKDNVDKKYARVNIDTVFALFEQ